MPTNEKSQNKSQLAKFKETAKQVETDNSVENFDKALKRVATRAASSAPAKKIQKK
jgi:hypothetical protein